MLQMRTGSLQPATNFGAWSDKIDVIDTSDGDPLDLSGADEITLKLYDPLSESVVLTLTKSGGDITATSAGRISWTATATEMSGLDPLNYEVRITYEVGGETYALALMQFTVQGYFTLGSGYD